MGRNLKAYPGSGKKKAHRYRNELAIRLQERAGLEVLPGEHPIIPVMLGDGKLASDFADLMLKEGIYVVGFSFPVVPRGAARIRTQMSAAHEFAHIDRAVAAFEKVGKQLGVI